MFASVFNWLISLAVATCMIVSSLYHLSNPYFFLESILNYQLLPSWPRHLSWLVASFFMFATLISGLSIMLNQFRPAVFWFGTTLFFVFSAAQVWALSLDKDIACGCFGPSSHPIGVGSVSFAIALTLACLYLAIFDSKLSKKR